MSYDVSLKIEVDTGGPAKPVITLFDTNMTSNVAPMWRMAGCDLAEYHGRMALDLACGLQPALERMLLEPEPYRALNPKNGWGNYEGCCFWLYEILEACLAHPLAIVDI